MWFHHQLNYDLNDPVLQDIDENSAAFCNTFDPSGKFYNLFMFVSFAGLPGLKEAANQAEIRREIWGSILICQQLMGIQRSRGKSGADWSLQQCGSPKQIVQKYWENMEIMVAYESL